MIIKFHLYRFDNYLVIAQLSIIEAPPQWTIFCHSISDVSNIADDAITTVVGCVDP